MALPPPNRTALTGRLAWGAGCAALAALVVAGCSTTSHDFTEFAERPPHPREAPIRVPDPLPDTRYVPLGAVAGAPPPVFPVAIHGGDLTLTGTVTGPGGPVDGARVLLERFVGDRSASLEVRADSRGTWRAIGIFGGRYRMRAWRAPDLGMAASDVRFLPAEDAPDVALTVDRYDGADVTGDVDDDAPDVGQTAVVTVLATHQQIDGNGIITTAPASGRDARITTVGPWQLQGSPIVVIDDAGRAQWVLTCTGEGSASVAVHAVGVTTTVYAMCEVPPPPPPPIEPPDPQLPIGASFTPPFAGPIPAGRYTVTDDPGTCVLTYEAWAGDHWDPARRTVTGTGDVVIPDIARDLRSLGDAPACTYRRAS